MSNPRFAKAVPSESMSAGWRKHRWIGALLILLAVIVVTALVASKFETHPSGIAAGVSPAPIAASSSFEITVENNETAPVNRPAGMVWIPGGEFSMGAQDLRDIDDEVGMNATKDSRPIHRVYVDGFWIDKTDVTNRKFAEFVKATGYVTVAERTPKAEDFPDAPPENLVAGSVVFHPPNHAIPLNDYYQRWTYVDGANWCHPEGPKSNRVAGRFEEGVLHSKRAVEYDPLSSYANAILALTYSHAGMGDEAVSAAQNSGHLTSPVGCLNWLCTGMDISRGPWKLARRRSLFRGGIHLPWWRWQ